MPFVDTHLGLLPGQSWFHVFGIHNSFKTFSILAISFEEHTWLAHYSFLWLLSLFWWQVFVCFWHLSPVRLISRHLLWSQCPFWMSPSSIRQPAYLVGRGEWASGGLSGVAVAPGACAEHSYLAARRQRPENRVQTVLGGRIQGGSSRLEGWKRGLAKQLQSRIKTFGVQSTTHYGPGCHTAHLLTH